MGWSPPFSWGLYLMMVPRDVKAEVVDQAFLTSSTTHSFFWRQLNLTIHACSVCPILSRWCHTSIAIRRSNFRVCWTCATWIRQSSQNTGGETVTCQGSSDDFLASPFIPAWPVEETSSHSCACFSFISVATVKCPDKNQKTSWGRNISLLYHSRLQSLYQRSPGVKDLKQPQYTQSRA